MARKKKGSSGGLIFVGIIGLLALIASIPKEVLISVGVLFGVAYYLYAQNKKNRKQSVLTPSEESLPFVSHGDGLALIPTHANPHEISHLRSRIGNDEPVIVTTEPASPTSFRIPSAPKDIETAKWIASGQSIDVAGITIPGGMIYVGTSLKIPFSGNDPCLIDPSKSVSAQGDYTERQTNYWPSYSEVSASARRAYLNWLADGRRDPEADMGYVFLFFYGLERRAIIDASKDLEARADRTVIANEIRRLLGIYGDKSNSFRRYASELLDWAALAELPTQLYQQPVPEFPKTFELPLYVRLALGQASVDGASVPSHLALAWVKLDPNINLRTPAKRCTEQFDQIFHQKYVDVFGDGMVLPRNRTKLKFVYRPASAGFHGYDEIKLTFGETPDVTVLTAPLKKLQQIVEAATKEIEPYSRYLGKNTNAKASTEGLLYLPATLWPQSTQKALQLLKDRMDSGMLLMPFQDLLSTLFDEKAALTKDKTCAFARALESVNIGMEPDVLGGAKSVKPDDKVVLFMVPPSEPSMRTTPAYLAALLTLQLASAVALADGDFNASEINHLRLQIQSWTHLTPSHTRRLLAHLRLLITAPVSLITLKKKLEPLALPAKEAIAVFMSTLAQADEAVSPDELKVLEKVYKLLGVEPKKVFSNVHAATFSSKSQTASPNDIEKSGFRLDPIRLAALQRDSENVSALLANIFTDEEATNVNVPATDIEAEETVSPTSILGLDEDHTVLARMLLSRPQWSREELLDLTADLDLMLDGALERINEASFDKHDLPFTEGHNPIEINTEILEKIEI